MAADYTEEHIRSLEPREHIRLRPGMYIGKLGDGTSPDDGIYILLKETIDNCIDEFVMGNGKQIDIEIDENFVRVRDYGRGIPLGKLKDCASIINTGAKYDSEAFKKSVGLNGVGIKAVNFLSEFFEITAFRDKQTKGITFGQGLITDEMKKAAKSSEPSGTMVCFEPDGEIFGNYSWDMETVETMLRNYAYLNTGLTLTLNGKKFKSKNGLLDLLEENLEGAEKPIYPIIHLVDKDIEIAFTHTEQSGEEYYSFVNGQHTTMGGSHLAAFREAIVSTIRTHFKKQYDAPDVRSGIVAAVSVKVEDPVFESQTKTKLGSTHMAPDGETIRTFVGNYIGQQLDNVLHRRKETADAMLEKIQRSEHERKEMKGIKKLARERAKQTKLHNKKLRDCRAHLNSKHKLADESTLFITEGDSASGSITKARNVDTQAVFSLRGKPLNSYGMSQKVVYQNEEFNLLQAALGIEDGIEGLRYNKVVLATDADVDGMHIRLLAMTFFLQFFPDLIRDGHLYILETPLFRVRNKKETRYCYSDEERIAAINEISNPEITRFKGLGEISPDEFKFFIGDNVRLSPVAMPPKPKMIQDLLTFYMGKNTPQRQEFIIRNLRFEADLVEEGTEDAA
ncbi:type IIA DNA topoisomerase subunit B [Verrucomicrobiales bacterium]|jgi:topoisomerase-4 subunit B|nr:type IIA DNA topoisomerase subunit B [Verrucomicrobiales bacterium]MDA9923243.1 type IIA DNA topoisomerase subunit B [Verrucomicrobiales bacterium]MDB2497089.1 type IIA DNA topoisomerase subunit B [Verrucomicrobiales bacterium]MDB3940327.1 type IIA DNA topoisomerase subunit B [Verrucomicrobiales bacterium]